MKYMRLGSNPDTFYTSQAVRSVSAEVSSDLIIQVKETRYSLHKFPLLSKCLHLQKLCSEVSDDASPSPLQTVQLQGFPGGPEAFEVCAKFCYGMTVTLNAYNIVAIRCAAEYLQMTEDAEKGNLVYKVEVFFNSCILHGWRDSIIALQSTKAFSVWPDNLGLTTRCIEAIATKFVSHARNGGGEDLAKLGIDLYSRTMIAIKSSKNVPANAIGDALRIYSSQWLPMPNLSKYVNNEDPSKDRLLLESIVSLLPAEKGAVSCSFLLKLLKAANILKTSSSSKNELSRKIALQLDEASANDLLIPSLSSTASTMYDADAVITILHQFMLHTSPPVSERQRFQSSENSDTMFQDNAQSSSPFCSSMSKVGKLADRYLQMIARDRNLPLSKFTAIAEAIPETARLDHDELYKAIDIYLEGHPELDKSERKRICRVLDCKKLSMEACMHAAQNEMLPLRVLVKVLVSEQARTAKASEQVAELSSKIKALLEVHKNSPKTSAITDQWCISCLNLPKLNLSTLKTNLEQANGLNDSYPNPIEKQEKFKPYSMTPNRPKRLVRKLWPILSKCN